MRVLYDAIRHMHPVPGDSPAPRGTTGAAKPSWALDRPFEVSV